MMIELPIGRRDKQIHSLALRDNLSNGCLDDAGGALARQRRRDKADAWTRPDEILLTQPACASHRHAREQLIHGILQRALLARDIERWCITRRRGRRISAFPLADADCVAGRRWMWMICKMACEGIVSVSTRRKPLESCARSPSASSGSMLCSVES